jgi:hypothetical protein
LCSVLFAQANPLIARWLDAIDLAIIFDHLSFWRIAFWLIAASLVWPFVFMRLQRPSAPAKGATEPAVAQDAGAGISSRYLGMASILRSLILFNALFAVQTVLDLAFLWRGVAPEGMSYASYAHRGAYPLIVTALLAAAFVIIALRPGSAPSRSTLVRGLVYLWVAQNVMLVISSILRLDLYVDVYSLTYWRISAFVWMVLVAIGLVLIVARIALDRSTAWLIRANLVALALTLYACAYVNFAGLIADYNLRHSAEVRKTGYALDRSYTMRLGPHAIPALDTYLALKPRDASTLQGILDWRRRMVAELTEKLIDWRARNYWDWRLAQYLAAAPTPDVAPAVPPP